MARSEAAVAGMVGPTTGWVQERRELAAWLEPTEAYARLRAAGLRPTLLDAASAHPEARWAFVAFDPMREIRVKGGRVADSAPDVPKPTGVVPYLRAAFAATRFPGTEAAPFTGGWVGFFGYAFARHLDPRVSVHADSGPGPDALLRLHRGAIAFDLAGRKATLFMADLEGVSEDARSRLAVAEQALARETPALQVGTATGGWEPSLGQEAFEAAVRKLQALVHDGDHFQANLATRFRTRVEGDPLALYGRLRLANPGPFMALLEDGDFAIASSSPEQLLAIEGRRIRTRPIAGTRKRGATLAEDEAMERELVTDPKEQAEHTMLVDLLRNDVARVSRPGTVRVAERMSVERYRHVMHLVSRVEGELRPGADLLDAFAAIFPGGTVTGAPKLRAARRIAEAEPVPRGPYTGSVGYLSWSGNAQWNILIRTLVLHREHPAAAWTADVHAGSGIVAGADPGREWKETNRKAKALLDAVEGTALPAASGPKPRLGEVTRHGSWNPPRATKRFPGARVLLVDNEDSFVHNLADYAAALGAAVEVIPNRADWRAAMARFRPTHIILSPGPGWPRDAGCSEEMARELTGRLPVLGVCLGHQAIASAHGGRIGVKGPVHGRTDAILHQGAGLFAGLPSPFTATRYHSLVVEEPALPPEWMVTARLGDGTVMALRHRRHPTHGLQFHPESLCTEHGLELLARFLGESV
ncbi:MAG TPA: chorismate-binding protein [Candidatus Thermoplasmatota archaeon]|nr:chorismate-binding protein [Candidatus Thermoplasmatota archaeon]